MRNWYWELSRRDIEVSSYWGQPPSTESKRRPSSAELDKEVCETRKGLHISQLVWCITVFHRTEPQRSLQNFEEEELGALHLPPGCLDCCLSDEESAGDSLHVAGIGTEKPRSHEVKKSRSQEVKKSRGLRWNVNWEFDATTKCYPFVYGQYKGTPLWVESKLEMTQGR